jgi:hypothetical protein
VLTSPHHIFGLDPAEFFQRPVPEYDPVIMINHEGRNGQSLKEVIMDTAVVYDVI